MSNREAPRSTPGMGPARGSRDSADRFKPACDRNDRTVQTRREGESKRICLGGSRRKAGPATTGGRGGRSFAYQVREVQNEKKFADSLHGLRKNEVEISQVPSSRRCDPAETALRAARPSASAELQAEAFDPVRARRKSDSSRASAKLRSSRSRISFESRRTR